MNTNSANTSTQNIVALDGSPAAAADELTVLHGGIDLDVELRDGSKETVKVLQLSVRQLMRYADLQGNEAALVELYCAKDEGWDDTITYPSHVAIVQLGDRLNSPSFIDWASRRGEAVRTLSDAKQKLLASLGLPSDSAPEV